MPSPQPFHSAPKHPLPSFPAFQEYLDSLGLFRMTPWLDRIIAVLETLGLKRPPFVAVQVAGTNGKGSTSSMLASLTVSHGVCTGLHTSPHFISVRERIRINGRMLPEAQWLELANKLLASGGETLSYFEFVTVMAVMAFAAQGVQLAVMETGLGGSFDATTALDADLVLLTPFGLDHQAVLGPSLKDIARDKAGAIRRGKAVYSAPQEPEAQREIVRTALERHAALYSVEPLREDLAASLALRLDGEHQKTNAALALAGWRNLAAAYRPEWFPPALGRPGGQAMQSEGGQKQICRSQPAKAGLCTEPVSHEHTSHKDLPSLDHALLGEAYNKIAGFSAVSAVPPQTQASGGSLEPFQDLSEQEARGLARAWLPGRMQTIPASGSLPSILLDGAHNKHAFEALSRSLDSRSMVPKAAIFACLEDKGPLEILPLLRGITCGPVYVPPIQDNPRAMEPQALASLIGPQAVPVLSMREALDRAAAHMHGECADNYTAGTVDHPLLICGSLYLLGQFFALYPEYLEG